MTDGTFRGHWVDEVFRSPLITDSVRVALLAMARDMDEAGRVSVPRVELAARLGRGKARISERIQTAVDAGFLSRVSVGKKGSTAVYAGALPKGSGGVDPKPDPETERKGPEGWTQSEHFGSGLQDAKTADTVHPSGPHSPKKGPDGGDANMYWGSSVSDLSEDVTGEALFDLSAATRREPPKKQSRRKPEIPVPADFMITAAMCAWAKDKGVTPSVDLEYQTERFINHALQNDRRCRDWEAAWRNWMLKEKFEGRDTSRNRNRSGASNGQPRGGALADVNSRDWSGWETKTSGGNRR